MITIGVSLLLLLVILTMVIVFDGSQHEKRSAKYTKTLIEKLNTQQQVKTKDVFDFQFDCAYVFNDSYLSGEGFAKRYHLDISINQVESGVRENIRRIVFVDEWGNFVFNYQYDSNELNAKEEGMIIYPNTVIKKTDPVIAGAITIEFLSTEYYIEN